MLRPDPDPLMLLLTILLEADWSAGGLEDGGMDEDRLGGGRSSCPHQLVAVAHARAPNLHPLLCL